MPRLILVNGPPASGKSTLAQLYVSDHPLSLDLDIDRVRAWLGRWLEQPAESGRLARELALAMARTHLVAGHDVVVPQVIARQEALERFEQIAHEVGATFHEVVLMDTRDNVLRRFEQRSRHSHDPMHLQARLLADDSGGAVAVGELYDRLLALVSTRPSAIVIRSEDGRPRGTYDAFRKALAAPTGQA